MDAFIKNKKLKEICCEAIHTTLHDLIPVPVILRTYMNPDMSEVQIGDDEPEPEPEEEPEPEPEEPEPVNTPQMPIPPPTQMPLPQPDVKQIPIVDHSPPLFEDAPAQKPQQQ